MRSSQLKFSIDPSGKSRVINANQQTMDPQLSSEMLPTVAKSVSIQTMKTLVGPFMPQTSKRRVHADGLKMLDQHYQMKEDELKLQSMENRVRRLEFEDKRAAQ